MKLKSLPENDIRLLKYVLGKYFLPLCGNELTIIFLTPPSQHLIIIDSSNTGFVNIHKYDEFVKGFGPLEACLRNIKLLFCKPYDLTLHLKYKDIKPKPPPFLTRWWHGYLSSEEADFLLRGMPAGTFLGRMSVSNPGSFAIAFVDSSGKVNHILVKSISTPLIPNGTSFFNSPSLIIYNQNLFRFIIGRGIYLPMHEGRAIVFTDLFSLVESKRFGFLKTPYQSDLIKERYIYLFIVSPPPPPSLLSFLLLFSLTHHSSGFHGTATREEALELLTDQPPGTYLLRLSQSNQNCLAIAAVAEEGNVYHSLIKRMNGKYGAETDADCTFASIAETVWLWLSTSFLTNSFLSLV